MNNYLKLPLVFVKFWYYDALFELIRFFLSLNDSFIQLFSLSLFIRTYLKPVKNEYRQGLVGFSVATGIFLKTILITADLLIFAVLIAAELIVVFCFFFFPVATIGVLFL